MARKRNKGKAPGDTRQEPDGSYVESAGDPGTHWWRSLEGIRQRLTVPVAADSFAVFRCGFGLLMIWNMSFYVLDGRAERLLYGTLVKFRFQGFEWVPVFGKVGTLAICWIALLCAVAIAFGIRYRAAAAIFATCYALIFLYDTANYNNHDYLVVLLGYVLALVPYSAVATVGKQASPRTIPTWGLWLLGFHLALPYTFGGIAKLGYDWVVRHEPMTIWFREGRVEGLESTVSNPEFWGMALSLGGVLFDLSIVPLLLWKRTRLIAYFACVGFHLANSQLFIIGPFPWLMIVGTTIFLAPTWPRTLRLTSRRDAKTTQAGGYRLPTWAMIALAAWIVIQCLLPFRHYAYPGEVNWTEEGARFAWRMKLRDKISRMDFLISEGGGPFRRVTDLDSALTARQRRLMEHKPEMVRHFAWFVREQMDPAGVRDIQIRVENQVSLNGRPRQELIDPEVDLLTIKRSAPASEWLVPLRPLP